VERSCCRSLPNKFSQQVQRRWNLAHNAESR
jgi:hypothetical protein